VQRIQPGLGARPESQAPRAVGQSTRRAAQDAQALLFQVVRHPVGPGCRVPIQLLRYLQLRSHFSLRRVCCGAILRGEDDAKTSIPWHFYDTHGRRNSGRKKHQHLIF
jgi:hypothetical protein